jgi:large subunit ribosomal protein L17
MRHRYFGRKFSRTKNERHRLFLGLLRDLIIHGRIITTLSKAKAVQPLIEKMISKAKKAKDDTGASLYVIRRTLSDKAVIKHLLEDAKYRFVSRSSGFTRIIKIGPRLGDTAHKVVLEFVDAPVEVSGQEHISGAKVKKTKSDTKEKNEKKPKIKGGRTERGLRSTVKKAE